MIFFINPCKDDYQYQTLRFNYSIMVLFTPLTNTLRRKGMQPQLPHIAFHKSGYGCDNQQKQ